VNNIQLAKNNMAKSVMDEGQYMFKQQIVHNARRIQGTVKIANESYSTQTCSACGIQPESRPRGIVGLEMRTWECSYCGAKHDRDHNAALNILSFGLDRQSLIEERPTALVVGSVSFFKYNARKCITFK
jgi:putative transposase